MLRMDIKKYNLPITCITITGSKVRVTPGLLAKFAGELARKDINIEAVSSGEYAVSFYVEAESGQEALRLLQAAAVRRSAFEAVSVRKNIGMISATGAEFVNTPGMLARVLKPLSDCMIDVLSLSTSFDSVLIFVDVQYAERAFAALSASFEAERPGPVEVFEVPSGGGKKEGKARRAYREIPSAKKPGAKAKRAGAAKKGRKRK